MSKKNLFNSKNLGVILLIAIVLLYAPLHISLAKPIGTLIIVIVAVYLLLK